MERNYSFLINMGALMMVDTTETGKVLNAFRMGVIPDATLHNMITAREEEINELARVLKNIKQDDISGIKIINGEYGTGKTFFLRYIKEMALEQNFVASSITVSSSFNFGNFSDIYTEVLSHLSVGGSNKKKGTCFEDIFEDWINKLKKKRDLDHATKDIYEVISTLNDYNNSFSSVLLSYIRGKISNDYEISNIAASWIKGDKNIPYELKRRLKIKGSVDKDNAMNMLRGFAKLVSLIGYSGLIITIDEAELIMNNRVDTRKKAYGNIRQIIDACGSNHIEKCGFILAGTDQLLKDEEKGFKCYEPLYQRIGNSIEHPRHSIAGIRQPVINLSRFNDNDFYEITKKVIELHERYYNHIVYPKLDTIFNLTMIECDKTKNSKGITIRGYLKKLVEILDLFEEKPDLPIFNTKVNRIMR